MICVINEMFSLTLFKKHLIKKYVLTSDYSLGLQKEHPLNNFFIHTCKKFIIIFVRDYVIITLKHGD